MTDAELELFGFIPESPMLKKHFYYNYKLEFYTHIPIEYKQDQIAEIIFNAGKKVGHEEGKNEFIREVKTLFKIDN